VSRLTKSSSPLKVEGLGRRSVNASYSCFGVAFVGGVHRTPTLSASKSDFNELLADCADRRDRLGQMIENIPRQHGAVAQFSRLARSPERPWRKTPPARRRAA